MTALVTGASAGSEARSPRRWRGRARGSRCRAAMSRSWRLPRIARRRSCRAAVQPVGRRRGRPARPAGGRGARRQARHPRQQCRRHPRQSPDADEGRGVRGGHPDQPRSRVPADARGGQADDEGAVRADHLDHLGRRRDRQPRPGQLCRVQGRPDRHDQGGRAGACEPRHHRQRGRAGLHDFGDDRRAQRPAARSHPVAHSAGRDGQRRRHRRGLRLPRSKEAGYVTGQTLHVNGGMAMP